MSRLKQAASLLLLLSTSLTGCGSPATLVVAAAPLQPTMSVDEGVPYRCDDAPKVAPGVPVDFQKTLFGISLDLRAALDICIRKDRALLDLATRVPGSPDPVTATK